MFLRPRWQLIASLLAAFFVAGSGHAQVIVEQMRDDVPVLATIDRSALRPGETTVVALRGEKLNKLRDILCDTVRLVEVLENDDKSARLKLEAAADATPGVYPLHLLCEAGLSNPRLLLIDPQPQVVETEDNDSFDKANSIEQPCGVSGVLRPEDRDYFRFQASAGETLVFDLRADRIGSPVRGELTLFDPEGREIDKAFTPSLGIAPDVRLVHRFARSGTYAIRVTDRTFSGADYAAYHLTLSDAPFLEAMFPLGGRRGESVRLEFSGGSPSKEQTWSQLLELPDDVDWSRARLAAQSVHRSVRMPAQFAVGDFAEHTEHEPNDTQEDSRQVAVPVTINGRIERPGDVDCFRLQAKTGESLFFDVFAERLGTPLDAIVVVRDAQGKVIAEEDDATIPERLPPVVRLARDDGAIDDPHFEATFPKGGEYVIEIRDRFDHGGPAFGYRLEIAAEPQDFELIVQPGRVENSNPRDRRRRRQRALPQYDGRGSGALSIDRGGRGSLVVRAIRRGYNGPIEIRLDGVPPQLIAQPAVIAAGQNQVLVDLLAGFEAESTAGFVGVTGVGGLSGRALIRRARQPVFFAALPPMTVAHQQLDAVAVGISDRGAELALRGEVDGTLTPGGAALVRIELRRREGVTGDVALAAVNLPAGLIFEQRTIADDEVTAELEVRAAADATPGRRTLQIEGKLTPKGKKEPLLALAPLELEVRPLASVELLTQTLEITPGGTATLEFRVAQAGEVARPVMLETARLPLGVTLGESTLPAGVASPKIEIRAEPDVRLSLIPRIVPIKPVLQLGERRLELPAQRLVLKIVKPKS